MEKVTVHFKRQGSAGLLILKGLNNYYVEYDCERGYLKVEKLWGDLKVKDKIYYEPHSERILYKNYHETEIGIENFTDIEGSINEVIDSNVKIKLENYIESYFIGSKKGDRDILNNINITDHSVQEVINECNINLNEFFKHWRVPEIEKYLINPPASILNMKFADLYGLIHWNCHNKKTFENIFIKAISYSGEK